MRAINPTTEKVIRDYPELSEQEAGMRLEAAEQAFLDWRKRPLSERAGLLRRVADLLREGQAHYAGLMTEEMGKPVAQAEAEVEKCAWCCEHYAEHGPAMLKPEVIETDAARSLVRFDPLGPILSIMPWNFPFWQLIRFAAPSLVAGNVVVLKHAPNVPGCALAIGELFRRAGYPEGVVTPLLISEEQAPAVIAHPAIRAVTLTGSERAGAAVAAEAGRHLKKTVLELGGSDPFLVLADVNPEEVARHAVKARTQNTGQSCIAAKRFIVEEAVADRFTGYLIEEMAKLRVGDPADRDNHLGPMARLDLLEHLRDQVKRSVDQGAEMGLGGGRMDREGYFFEPTVLTGVKPGMPAFDGETFGPVAAVTRVANADEAVEMANRSPYGLGASVWTRDIARAERLAEDVEAGLVFINEMVKSDPRLPFGGVKRSGYGRELSRFGLHELVNVKTVWVA